MPHIADQPAGADAIAQHGRADLSEADSHALPHAAEAFGIGWRSAWSLPAFHPADTGSWAARGLPTISVQPVATLAHRDVTLSLNTQRLRQMCRDGARVEWGEEALFDLIAEHGANGPGARLRIDLLLGTDWRGSLPSGFYATVAALACGWRGDVPCHASTVAWRGKAVLVTGPAGAGKSTSLAAMLAAGAQLVGDDLSVLTLSADQPQARRGRPDVRLHPDTLPLIALAGDARPADDSSGKWIARPAGGWNGDSLPLGAMLWLEADGDRRLNPVEAMARVPSLLFRPRMQAALPEAAQMMAAMRRMAATLPSFAVQSPADFTPAGLRAHGERLLALASSR